MTKAWRNRIVGHGEETPDQLLANPANWRIHPKVQQSALSGVLGEIGWIQNVIVNRTTGHVVDGHLRVELAISRNEPTVPVVYVELTEAEEKLALATIDPLSALAVTDADKLGELLAGIESDSPLVQALMESIAADNHIATAAQAVSGDDAEQIDRAEELQAKWQVKRGDLWTIGDHRLLCGDSTNADDVATLMGGGKSDLVVTDPPYGVKMDKGFGGVEGFGGGGTPIARRKYSDDWDSERPAKVAFDLMLSNTMAAIIFGGNFFADMLPRSTHWIVWDKLNTMPTFGDCELAWTNIDRKSVKKFTFEYNGLIGKEKDRAHPTQKPAGLFVEILQAYSTDNAVIYDPFCGSGTTLVACQQTGRHGRAIELEPKYVAVALERLSLMGLTPALNGIGANDVA